MPKISEAWIEKEIRKLMVQEEYSPRQTYEELKRRARENGWNIEGTTGLSETERNRKIKKMVKSHLSTLEKIKYYIGPPPLTLPGAGLSESRSRDGMETGRADMGAVQAARGDIDRGKGLIADGGRPENDNIPSESKGIPAYSDEQWDQIKDDIAGICDETRNMGRKTASYINSQVEEYRRTGRPVDLSDVPGNPGHERLRNTILPYLDDANIPHTDVGRLPFSDWIPFHWLPMGGYTIGRIWGYLRYWVVFAAVLISGALTLGSLFGGVSDLFTPSGIFWLVVFIASSSYWYARLDMHLPVPGVLKDDTPSDEFLLGVEVLIIVWALMLASVGTVPILGPLGLDSIQLSTVWLLLGLVSAYALYHGEAENLEDLRRGASAARERARETRQGIRDYHERVREGAGPYREEGES